MAHFDDIYDIAADGYGIITAAQAREAGAACTSSRAGCPRPTTPTPRPWRSWAAGPTYMASPCSPPSNSGDRELAVANRKLTAPNRQPRQKRGQFMESKYEEMARQMRADGVSEETIARFIAEEVEEDEFRRGKGITEIEALRE